MFQHRNCSFDSDVCLLKVLGSHSISPTVPMGNFLEFAQSDLSFSQSHFLLFRLLISFNASVLPFLSRLYCMHVELHFA